MNLKTYQAYTMAQALAAVKQDLGADAVILNTRTFRRGGFMGIGARLIVEVSATPAEAPSRALPRRSMNSAAAQRAYAGAASPVSASIKPDHDRIKTLAMAIEESSRRQTPAAPPPVAITVNGSLSETAATASSEIKIPPPATSPEGPARRFLLSPAEQSTVAKERGRTRPVRTIAAESEFKGPKDSSAARSRHTPVGVTDAMQTELSAIRTMVGQVLQRQARTSGPSPAMPQALFDMYLRMVSQDISDELADQVMSLVREDLDAEACGDERRVREAVLHRLSAFIPTADEAPPSRTDGRPRTIALIGPTGVGKTTTVAKLAATFKLRHARNVGLITADTYRIAAVDQLRTYANIIGLPLQVAMTPAEMRQAVRSLSDCDVILIDTAGRSQNDTGRLVELKRFIDAADTHEVHMVLSSTAGEKVLLREAEAFSAIGVDRVVLTKLDEAVSFGVLVNVIRQVGRQLSFLTTGQEVPDHIEPGRASRLAELVLEGMRSERPGRGALVAT